MIKIIDNFVGSTYNKEISSAFLGNNFPWFILDTSVEPEYDYTKVNDVNGKEFINSVVFRHWFSIDRIINSDFFVNIEPIADNIVTHLGKDIILQNCSVNLLTSNDRLVGRFSPPHIDIKYSEEEYEQYDTYTGLYYVNDADGDTILYNEIFEGKDPNTFTQKMSVSPKPDRLIIWDSRIYHSAPAGSSSNRVVINFNFRVEK